MGLIFASEPVGAIHGVAPSEVWLGGTRGTLLEWDGSGFARRTSLPPAGPCADVHAPSSTSIWVACGTEAVAWDGTSWSHYPATLASGEALQAIWAVSPTSVWGATSAGAILHFDGSTWTTSTTYAGSAFVDIWASSDSDVWVADDAGGLAHWNGSSWSGYPTGASALSRVWGSSSSDVYAVGTTVAGQVLHFDGSSWSSIDVGIAHQYGYVSGSGADDVWIAGAHTAAHWDGTSWTEHSVTANTKELSVAGDGVPVVLSDGAIWRWNGTSWVEQLIPSSTTFVGMSAVSDVDITIAGSIVMRLR